MILSLAQLVIGFIGHSQALIADSIHTLSDLTADILVMAVTRTANKGADEDHPYGYTRYETLATTVLAILLIAVAVGIAISSIDRILHPTGITPSILTPWVAALTIAGKEGLYHYTVYISRKVKSRMLEASAWHHRSDAISSVVVLVGIAGAIVGIPMFDSLARPVGDWRSTLPVGEIGLTTSRDILEAMARGEGPADRLVALGYAGWAPGQLEDEIKRNGWLTVNADLDVIFRPPEGRYDAALGALGVTAGNLSEEAGHA